MYVANILSWELLQFTAMNNTTFCTLLIIFLSAVRSTLGTFQKLTFSTSGFPCAVDSPAKVFPIEEIPSVPKCVPSSVLCSWKCHMEPNCIGYNVNTAKNQCQLYDYIPINFKMNTTCNFFQVNPLHCLSSEHRLCRVLNIECGRHFILPLRA